MLRLLTLLLITLLFPIGPALAESDPDVLEFCFMTDSHKWGPTADVRYADVNINAFVRYCNETPGIQFALHGGDFMNAYDTNHEQALYCLEHARRDFEGLHVPFYATKGNHDCNGKQRLPNGSRDNTQIVTDREFHRIFSPLSPDNPLADSTGIVIDPTNPEGNYYYRDFPRHRFRLIVLNDYDLDSLEYYGYHGPQMKWLAEKALYFADKEQPTEWCFLILGHGFGFNMFGKPISRLLHAYINGQDFEDSDRGYSYHCPFDKLPRAQLVALIGGHNHEDLYDNPDGYNIIHVNRGFATGGEVGIPDEELCFDHFILNTRERTLLEHRIGRGRDHLFSYNPATLVLPTITFPEAMGMGGFTHGGAKGREVWVTNLDDDGPGSLRWAINQPGNRMVCFGVSGTIHLRSPLVIQHDSISICGHSAPGQGIAIQGHSLQILASEVILRYLHLRSCPVSDGDFGQANIIFDHLSASFTDGPAISIRRAQNVTVQNCLVSHTRSIGIEAGGYMATYYRNLIAHCPQAMHFPDGEGENRWVHIFRNVFHNWQDHAMYGGGRGGEITIEENYFLPGPATQNRQMLDVADDGTGRYYVSGNSVRGREREWDRQLVNDRPGMPYDPAPGEYDPELRQRMDLVARPQVGTFTKSCLVVAAFHYRSLFTRPTRIQTRREALFIAGCSLERDSYDRALIASLRQDTVMSGTQPNGFLTTVDALGGYPRIKKQRHQPRYSVLAQWLDSRTAAVHERSIVVLFDNDTRGATDTYPRLAGHHDAILGDSCYVTIVSTGSFLANADTDSDPLAADTSVIRLMQATGYDAICLGSQEVSRPQAQLRQLLRPMQHCVVSANLRSSGGSHERQYRPYRLCQYGRRVVAYVGVSMPGRNTSEQLYATVQQSINQARDEGANYVVLLTHLPDQDTEDATDGLSLQQLITHITGADVVLDGYATQPMPMQTLTDRAGHSVVVSRTGQGPHYVGKLIIAPDDVITTQLMPIQNLRFKSRRITQILDQLTSK